MNDFEKLNVQVELLNKNIQWLREKIKIEKKCYNEMFYSESYESKIKTLVEIKIGLEKYKKKLVHEFKEK